MPLQSTQDDKGVMASDMLKDLQKRIYKNKINKGFNTAADYEGLNQEICFLAEEVGEIARSHRRGERREVVDSVTDVLIYTLGLLEILGVDADEQVEKVLKNIEKRKYKKNLNGGFKRVKG